MTFKPYTVVVVPFPFTDGPTAKKRPALVISKEAFQKNTGHVCLLMITSAKNSNWFGDHDIADLIACGLPTPSIVRQKAFTIDIRLIQKSIGVMAANDIQKVSHQLEQNICRTSK